MILYMKYEKQNKNTKLIIKGGEIISLKANVLKVLEELCNSYGNTYEGRKAAIKKELGIVQKIPILINSETQDIFFPLFDLRKKKNYWINYRYIDHASPCDNHACWITFNDKNDILFPVNIKVIKAQLKRCEKYLYQIHCNRNRYESNEIPFNSDKME